MRVRGVRFCGKGNGGSIHGTLFDTAETIGPGFGFPYYGVQHQYLSDRAPRVAAVKAVGELFVSGLYPGSPLLWFEKRWGNHLLRDPVLLMAAAAVMSVPTRFMGQKRRRVYPG